MADKCLELKEGSGPFLSNTEALLYSVAVSLKRIADSMEKTLKKPQTNGHASIYTAPFDGLN